ncbi:MAG: alpha/beta fold hydrolase [Verrucomicrobiota bacterium]
MRFHRPASFPLRIALLFATLLPVLRAQDDPVTVTDVVLKDVTFAHLGQKPAAPAPTVLVFAMDRKTSLQNPSFARGSWMLRSAGFFCVSLDMPAHGDDARKGEEGLKGWSVRLERGENFVAPFTQRVTSILDYLIREGYSQPQKIAVIGISRGGFIALHTMAADPRVTVVAALAPVTELNAVREFTSPSLRKITESLSVGHLIPRLAGRPLWVLIGNRDERVGTAPCVDFMKALWAATPAESKTAPAELHIVPGEDHRQPPLSQEKLVAWIKERLASP